MSDPGGAVVSIENNFLFPFNAGPWDDDPFADPIGPRCPREPIMPPKVAIELRTPPQKKVVYTCVLCGLPNTDPRVVKMYTRRNLDGRDGFGTCLGCMIEAANQHRSSQIGGMPEIPDFNIDPKLIERSKMSPQLRFAILHRDGFKCRACGATPESGAQLHIDHIKPVARGGLTEWDNLQALCATCNIGKGATWREPEDVSAS